ncbi:MAG TPA: hypothetical protein ENK41_03130 [Rhodobacteraceae bacterium]|nr:hypothetical protein [Paracoccaceae bacterium]
MIRTILAAFAGIVIAMVVVMAVEAIGQYVYPPPPGIDVRKPEELARLIAGLPSGALVFVVAAWLTGALIGAFTGTWLSEKRSLIPAVSVGLAVTLGVLYVCYKIPHPLWMLASGLALPLPLAIATARWSRP